LSLHRIKQQADFFKAAAVKFKSLCFKLFHNVEDLKEALHHQKNIHREDINSLLVEYKSNKQMHMSKFAKNQENQRKMDFQRAISQMEPDEITSPTKLKKTKSKRIDFDFEKYSDDEVDQMRETEENEDRILSKLLGTKVVAN
jgi:hypothetical protein